MSDFQSGKKDGYIYGYIFYSGIKGLVLDEGSNEYPVNSAELLIDGEFVLVQNLTLDLLKSKGLYGSKARIKVTFVG
ncbi:hypothetical protein [Psychrobacillus sp. MER TA 171]|uniref:hypothetical protein n=1 Tax=Psychrobacillus sp. MER TA 171 TaxID=2939577 RepID=UPI00203D45DB|nr:hypothetical protein [Psychrobacillus sp. MER TA 171]